MRTIHHISLWSTAEHRAALAGLGFVVPASGYIAFDVAEESPAWPEVASWMRTVTAADVVTTTFDDSEILAADSVELRPQFQTGYPEPKVDEFGYRGVTYDTEEFCSACGIGLRQIAAFRMKGEPNWGRNTIMQLNWVFDEFFVHERVATSVFAEVGSRTVENKKGAILTTVRQLVIDEVVEVDHSGLRETICAKCGRKKFLPPVRGAFPALVSDKPKSLARTAEYFGDGAWAANAIVASHETVVRMIEAKVRGVAYRPVAKPGKGV